VFIFKASPLFEFRWCKKSSISLELPSNRLPPAFEHSFEALTESNGPRKTVNYFCPIIGYDSLLLGCCYRGNHNTVNHYNTITTIMVVKFSFVLMKTGQNPWLFQAWNMSHRDQAAKSFKNAVFRKKDFILKIIFVHYKSSYA